MTARHRRDWLLYAAIATALLYPAATAALTAWRLW